MAFKKKESQVADIWFNPAEGKYGKYWISQQYFKMYAYPMKESGKLKLRFMVQNPPRPEKPKGEYQKSEEWTDDSAPWEQ